MQVEDYIKLTESLGISRGKLAGRFDDDDDEGQAAPGSFRPGHTVPKRESMVRRFVTKKTIYGRRRTNWERKLS